MAQEPLENSTDGIGLLHDDQAGEKFPEGEESRVVPLKGFGLARILGVVFDSISGFFSRLVTGKGRISVIAGVSAGLIVALGFFLFDMRKEEWMLRQKYPEAMSSYERHVLHARDLVLQKQYAKAEPKLRKLVEKQGGTDSHADALILFAECLEAPTRDSAAAGEAREVYQRFISEYPTDPRVPSAYVGLAKNFANCGLYEESNARYERVLRMVTDSGKRGEVEFLIAQGYYQERNLARAADLLEQIRQKYSGTPVCHDSALLLAQTFAELGKPNDAERVLLPCIDTAPGTPHAAAALHMLAENALVSGDYEKAIDYCTKWLRKSPASRQQVDVMLTLGLAKLQAGAPADAYAVASDIMTFFPNSPRLDKAMILRGEALEALGEIKRAENSYLEAARIAPDEASSHEHLARLYLSKERLPEAIEQMKYACEIAPREDAYFMELAKLYRRNGENVSALKVLSEFTRERQLSIFIGEAYLTLADIQVDLDRPQNAYKTLDRLLATGTATVSESVVLEKQGDILVHVGLYDDALETYRFAMEVGADSESVTIKIAKTILVGGNPRGCLDKLASIEGSVLSQQGRFDLMELKARALLELGMFAEARRAIREAIALRTGREKFSTLALLMQANMALEDETAALRVFEVTAKLIENEQEEAPAEARRIVLSWASYLYEKHDYAKAAKAYSCVVSPRFPSPDAAWATFQEGNCYYHMADHEKAGEVYDRLVNEFSDSEWVRFAKQKQKLMGIKRGT